MEDLTLKFNQLDSFSQSLVLDFIELLLKRKAENGAVNYVADRQVEYKRLTKTAPAALEIKPPASVAVEPAKVPFDENYRKRLFALPPWTDQEIEEFDNARDKMQNWKIEEW